MKAPEPTDSIAAVTGGAAVTAEPLTRRPHAEAIESTFTVATVSGAIAAVIWGLSGGPFPLAPVPTIAQTTGMLAGYGAAITLILVARVPLIDASIGSDRLTRWHAVTGATTLVATVVHAVFATVGYAQATGTGVAAIGGVLSLPSVGIATLGTVLILIAGLFSMRWIRRRIRYEVWHAIHLAMYVGIALSFLHGLGGPDIAGRPFVQVAWALLYAAAFGLLLRYRMLEPLLTLARQGLRVESVTPAGPGVATIVVRGRGIDELRARPGQFFRWRFLTRSTWTSAHPFSLSAPATASRLRLTVKVAGDGTRLLHALRPGVRVVAEGPYGGMTAERRTGHGALLIAGGVGITPMRALFETLPLRGEPLTLLYRASTADDLIFRDELEAIARQRGADIRFVVGRSSDPATRLDAARLHTLVPGLRERDVFICASPRFSDAMRSALHDAGVPRTRIHEERFSF